MSYTKTNWNSGDIITAEKLNNIENGIEGASSGSGGYQPRIIELTQAKYGDEPSAILEPNLDLEYFVGAWFKITYYDGGSSYLMPISIDDSGNGDYEFGLVGGSGTMMFYTIADGHLLLPNL